MKKVPATGTTANATHAKGTAPEEKYTRGGRGVKNSSRNGRNGKRNARKGNSPEEKYTRGGRGAKNSSRNGFYRDKTFRISSA